MGDSPAAAAAAAAAIDAAKGEVLTTAPANRSSASISAIVEPSTLLAK